MKIKLGTILIGVKNLSKSRDFYEKLLGMEITEFRPPFMQANLREVEFNIEEDAEYRSKNWGAKHIGGRKSFTLEVENIKSFFEKAESFGAQIIEEPQNRDWGWADGVIADLDGNEFTIEQNLKK